MKKNHAHCWHRVDTFNTFRRMCCHENTMQEESSETKEFTWIDVNHSNKLWKQLFNDYKL